MKMFEMMVLLSLEFVEFEFEFSKLSYPDNHTLCDFDSLDAKMKMIYMCRIKPMNRMRYNKQSSSRRTYFVYSIDAVLLYNIIVYIPANITYIKLVCKNV